MLLSTRMNPNEGWHLARPAWENREGTLNETALKQTPTCVTHTHTHTHTHTDTHSLTLSPALSLHPLHLFSLSLYLSICHPLILLFSIFVSLSLYLSFLPVSFSHPLFRCFFLPDGECVCVCVCVCVCTTVG